MCILPYIYSAFLNSKENGQDRDNAREVRKGRAGADQRWLSQS